MKDLELLLGAAREETLSKSDEDRLLAKIDERHAVVALSAGMQEALEYLGRARATPAAFASALGSVWNVVLIAAATGLITTAAANGKNVALAPAPEPQHPRPFTQVVYAPEDTLPIELSIVEEATRSLQKNEAGAAIGALDRFDALRAKTAHLEEERTALRVRALCALDRREEARALAARFAEDHPSSPLLRRLEQCLEEAL